MKDCWTVDGLFSFLRGGGCGKKRGEKELEHF